MIVPRGIKLRFVNQFVGAFLLLIATLLLVAVTLVALQQRWFAAKVEVLGYLGEGELDGLRIGTPVQILGRRIGKLVAVDYVEDIDPEQLSPRGLSADVFQRHQQELRRLQAAPGDRQWLLLRLEVFQADVVQVREDSQVLLRRRLGGLGDVYLEILRGPRGGDVRWQGRVYPVRVERSATDELQTVTEQVTQVQENFSAAAEVFSIASRDVSQLAGEVSVSNDDFRDLVLAVRQVMPDVSQVVASLTQSAPKLDRLLTTGNEAAPKLDRLLGSLEEIVPDIERLTQDAQEASQRVGRAASGVERTSREIGETNRQLGEVVADIQRVSPRLSDLADDAQELLQASQQSLSGLDRLVGTGQTVAERVERESRQLPAAVADVRQVTDGAQELLDGLRRSRLLRRVVPQPEPPRRLPDWQLRLGGGP